MYKTCSVCGKIHDYNKVCKRKTKQKVTLESRFRKSYQWQEKSKRIKQRDNYLCQICINNRYNTTNIYNSNYLEVHHIVPLNENYDLRLDELNLITLCRYHHELAEKRIISREELIKIVGNKYS